MNESNHTLGVSIKEWR